MRFVRLKVENFRAITTADLPLGPGLNVLYGPNDLGKSTLGVALRGALLLPGTSSQAAEYVPWQQPELSPRVTLDLVDDEGRYWRIDKHFGLNDATLSFSKDGVDFTVDAHERQVDEKVRKLLAWGIPSPGGRGGPKGMPESFLANALLAAQTDVDGILAASLEADPDHSGKVRLTKALSALASDPLVRHVLAAAQKEHDQHYTATGRRKGGRNAPITLASDEVKRLTQEYTDRQRALGEATTAEEVAKRLHERHLGLQQQAEALEAAHRKALGGRARAVEKRAAQQRLEQEQQALTSLDARALEVKALETQLASVTAHAQAQQAALDAVQVRVKTQQRAVREAEDTARKASSAEGEATRAVARATLQQAVAKASIERAGLQTQLEAARQQQKARDEAKQREQQRAQLTQQLGPARARVQELEGEARLISGIVNYGHWRAASDVAAQAQQLRAEAQTARAGALRKTAEALEETKAAKALEGEGDASLPDEAVRAAVKRLRHELELAEAALGGGVTVLVRPRSPLLLRSTADEGASDSQRVASEHVVEADRRVQLTIGDLVDIEVVAGAPDKRKEAERLKKKWKAEGAPVLERAGVGTVQELDERFVALQGAREQVKERRAKAAQLEREAQALRDRSAMLDEKAAGAPTAEVLEEKRQLIGELPVEVLEPAFKAMGATWERETRPQLEKTMVALEQAKAAVAKLEVELAMHQRTEPPSPPEGERVGERGDPTTPTTLQTKLTALEANLAALNEQLTGLERAEGKAVHEATTQLERATQQLAAVELEEAQLKDGVAKASAAVHAKGAECELLRSQVASAKRPELVKRVEAAAAQLATYVDVEVLTDDELAQREQRVSEARALADQARSDAAVAEGALSRIGGPQAREQLQQLEEALTLAKARERHLEVDAAAWRMLVEAVKAAEQEDGAGLGSALATPVTAQFAALTKGRYPAVKFTPALRAVGVEVPGTVAAPDQLMSALSVGTRDHLATLVRLAIALQLESAIVLDDHLVHSDPGRLEWFREALGVAAQKTQVLVLTCRPLDYVTKDALPTKSAAYRDVDARTRVVDLSRVITRR